MSRTIELPADTTAAWAARRLIEQQVADARLCRDARIIASELVANACSYGDPPFTISVESQDAADAAPALRISVSNRCRQDHVSRPQLVDGDRAGGRAGTPSATGADPQEGGRGLRLVNLLADTWGWEIDGGTMTVWAVLYDSPHTEPAIA